ncbi:BEN domain-containing protein 5 [Dermacentor silvarum]|uniref:BEN domain-containing protein 5 n=1 Tax=Dermacentor silvarum TaxID=543639 RepID=UPI001897FA60|nr:BEN domain-containing protein 5 [Dermacentor silvarum]
MKELADRQKDEIRKLRKLNEALQQKVITQMEEFIQNAKAAVPVEQPAEMVPPTTPPPVQGCADLNGKIPLPQMQDAAAASALWSPAAMPQKTSEVPGPEHMVDIGQGLRIPMGAWKRIQLQPKDSLFVKELVVAIWDPADLKGRSLQGKHCPRFPDRPLKEPLTPWKVAVMRECYKERLLRLGLPADLLQNSLKRMNHFVVEKLADVEKQAKRTEKTMQQ